jgi:hypothetical protein
MSWYVSCFQTTAKHEFDNNAESAESKQASKVLCSNKKNIMTLLRFSTNQDARSRIQEWFGSCRVVIFWGFSPPVNHTRTRWSSV